MTGLDHQDNPAIDEAARWLAAGNFTGRGIVPELRARFGLSAREACEAIGLAARIRRAAA